jgi:hypothetical protein
MCDMPDMSEEADAVADMPLMSIEVEEAIAMVLVAISMLRFQCRGCPISWRI